MGDLIRRDDVIKAIHGYWYNKMKELPSKPIGDDEEVIIDTRKANEYLEHNKQLSLFIQLIKTVEVAEPKMGRWIEKEGEKFDFEGTEVWCIKKVCSECSFTMVQLNTEKEFSYCPNCGARMED